LDYKNAFLNVILATQERYGWTSVTGSLARCHLLGTLVYLLLFFCPVMS